MGHHAISLYYCLPQLRFLVPFPLQLGMIIFQLHDMQGARGSTEKQAHKGPLKLTLRGNKQCHE